MAQNEVWPGDIAYLKTAEGWDVFGDSHEFVFTSNRRLVYRLMHDNGFDLQGDDESYPTPATIKRLGIS